MELRDLETFIVVAEELHFARAAQRLHLVPAAVTQRIQALEASFGVELFRRTSRRVELTGPGLRLVESTREALRAVDELQDLARGLAGEAATRLSVAVGPNLGPFLSPVLARLTAWLPELRPTAESMWSAEAASAVQRGEVGAAILRGPVLRSGLDETVLGALTDTFVAVPESSPLTRLERPVTRLDLDDRPVLLTDRVVAPGVHDGVVAYFADANVWPRWRLHRLQSYELLLPFVAVSGAAVLVHDQVTSPAPPGVVVCPLADPGPRSPVVLVTRTGDRSGPVMHLRAAAERRAGSIIQRG